ncbi:hypothetical protein [Virgibacillus oceani]|uniref:DUF8042 domain-containing protein n=1 Tax=Virgibacillus oceani TaxID=1479511 RepID=A0A917LZK3_9BACI|nr:hypothetical protein [Virgibacillus oceani]GGG67697.1 hypothetical protein GCM10011398_09330 [Virgibacillus oceani]
MEKYIEMMKHSQELQETVYEGLQHMQDLLKEGKFEATIPLFQNIVRAFSSVEKSILTLPDDILSEGIQGVTTKVRDALELVVESFEASDYGKIHEILQFTLIPRYKNWINKLEEMFRPYLVI